MEPKNTTTMMPVGMECRWPLMSLKQTRARTLLTPHSSRENCAFCCWGAVPVFLLVPVAVREPLAVEIARTQESSLRWKALLSPSLCHREKFVSEGLLLAAPRCLRAFRLGEVVCGRAARSKAPSGELFISATLCILRCVPIVQSKEPYVSSIIYAFVRAERSHAAARRNRSAESS